MHDDTRTCVGDLVLEVAGVIVRLIVLALTIAALITAYHLIT